MNSDNSAPPAIDRSLALRAILATALADLRASNSAAYHILLERAESGFMAHHQTPRSVGALAAELLGTLTGPGAGDED